MAVGLRGTVWWKAGRGEGSNLWKAPKGNAVRGNRRDGNRPERSGEADVKNARVDAGYQGCSRESCWRGEVSTCAVRGNGRDGNRPERSGEADVKNASVDAGYQGCSGESCWRGEVSTCTISGGEDPRDVGNGGMGSGDAAGRGCLMDCRES